MKKSEIPTINDFPYHRDISTRWDDNDIYGHLNNTVHYRLFDSVVNGFLLENGLLDFRFGKSIYLVVETGCSYFTELAYPDQLTVGLKITHLGTSSVRYETGLFKKGAGSAAAAGHFIHVNVTMAERRACPIDQNSRSVFARIII